MCGTAMMSGEHAVTGAAGGNGDVGRPQVTGTAGARRQWQPRTQAVAAGALPAAYRAFLQEHAGVDADVYARLLFHGPEDIEGGSGRSGTTRFVRVNGLRPPAEAGVAALASTLSKQLGTTAVPVRWLPGWFAFDGAAKLAGTQLHQQGTVCGIDASSGAAVYALLPEPGHAVLDLCAAPGGKTALIAELMACTGTLVAVDVSKDRLAPCATLLRRFGAVRPGEVQRGWRLLLHCGDGTRFQDPAEAASRASGDRSLIDHAVDDSSGAGGYGDDAAEVVLDSLVENVCGRSRAALVKGLQVPPKACDADGGGAHASRGLQSVRRALQKASLALPSGAAASLDAAFVASGSPAPDASSYPYPARLPPTYDRVLVDAECTHDGSLKHVAKFGGQWDATTLERRVLDPARLAALGGLQRGLLANGFRLLRPGGRLVYSTCSMATAQNEDVVAWLLAREGTARVVPLDLQACIASYCGDRTSDGVGDAVQPATAAIMPATVPQGAAVAGADSTAGSQQDTVRSAATTAAVDTEQRTETASSSVAGATAPAPAGLAVQAHAAFLAPPTVAGGIFGTLRFDPRTSASGGLFIACLTKVEG
jgi:16S rRNA C967 or C1407 C5-methylase (RsmB/RsmF family)